MFDRDIRTLLDVARTHALAGRVAEAAECYEYFFCHALDIDRTLVGVRNSFCLAEWAALGDRYPDALRKIESIRGRAAERFSRTDDPFDFVEMMAACKALGVSGEVMPIFRDCHSRNRNLAKRLFRLVWREIIEAGELVLSAECMVDGLGLYSEVLADVEDLIRLGRLNSAYHEKFVSRAAKQFNSDMARIGMVLEYAGRFKEAERLKEKASVDASRLGLSNAQ